MKKVMQMFLLVVLVFSFAGCQAPVVYDDMTDSFRYKPECEFDYLNSLSPKDHPSNPMWE